MTVRLHDGKTWNIKGEIVENLHKPMQYSIRTENRNILCHNRKQTLLWRKGSSDGYFKNETDDDEYYLIIMAKQITLLSKHQIIYVMKLKKQHR